ncbi:MAG: transporter [Phycisphaeraceae bacterium]
MTYRSTLPILAPLLAIASHPFLARGEEQAVSARSDKSGFHLFSPTPAELMRDLSADRPDATESPFTVDAGHVQVELSFFDYARDRENGDRLDAWTALDTNVKLGLTNDIDIQFVFAAYSHVRTTPAGSPTETLQGFGDFVVRLKYNFWGNDEGDPRTPSGLETTGLGIMPFIKIPTGTELSNDHVEGGIIIPLSVAVTEGIGLGFMAEIDFVYNDLDRRYDVEFVHTATIGFDIVGPVGAFVEYVGIISTDNASDYQAIFITGVTVEITPNLLFDLGLRVGLTDTAEDLGVFAGMTWRY